MQISITDLEAEGVAITKHMLGGNALIHRNAGGDAGTIDETFKGLGMGSVRYPGGSITEQMFDFRDPDNLTLRYGEMKTTEDQTLKFSDFMSWAATSKLSVTFVLPTRTLIDRETGEIDQKELRDLGEFVKKLLDPSGPWAGADISSLEIGNEYWGSGDMTSQQYGKVANAVLPMLDRIVSGYDLDTNLFVQIGETWGKDFDEGGQNAGITGWRPKLKAANEDIVSELSEHSASLIDGIVLHSYATSTVIGDRDNMDFSRWQGDLKEMSAPWLAAGIDVPFAATEWNVKSSEEQFGLTSAGVFLEVFSQLAMSGYEWADAWPVQLSSRYSLGGTPGEVRDTFTGAAFTMLSRLNGYTAMETGIDRDGVEVNAWGRGEDDRIFHLISRSDETISVSFDASDVLRDGARPSSVRILGVQEGTADGRDWRPGGSTDVPDHEDHGAAPAFRDVPLGDGEIRIDLAPGEVAEIIYGEIPSMFDPENPDADDTPPTSPEPPVVPPVDPEDPDDEEEPDDSGGGGGSCFVATAVYGSQSHPDVIRLRAIRDEVLVRSVAGRLIVRTYWKAGPLAARAVKPGSAVARAMKIGLSAIARLIKP